jgi:hypothetical protein
MNLKSGLFLLVVLLALAVPVFACDACDEGCCCPGCWPTSCAHTERKCYYGIGYQYSSCINVGEKCPWSGCAGWSCSWASTIEVTDVVSVSVGEHVADRRTADLALRASARRVPGRSPATPLRAVE